MRRLIINTVVISGFPGIGKTTFAKMYPTAVRDLTPEEYQFKRDISGFNILNPEWPNNYIEAIKSLDKSGMYRCVLVPSNIIIRNLMAKNNIRYTNICPEDSLEMRNIISSRLKSKHERNSVIEDIINNFSKHVKSMIDDKGASTTILLTPDILDKWQAWSFMY